MRSNPFALAVSVSCLVTPALLAALPDPPPGYPPIVRHFDLAVPLQQDRGGSVGRATALMREIDVSGVQSIGVLGSPSNEVLDLLFPPGTRIRGYGYDATFTYFGNPVPANPNMGFRFRSSSNDDLVENIAPGPSPAALSEGAAEVPQADWVSLPDGHLRVEFFEAVDNLANPDGIWDPGSITVIYDVNEVTECCIWDNGTFDNRTGALSQEADNRVPPIYHVMADDFYLEPNFVHMIEYIEAVFIVDNPAAAYNYDAPIGRLEIRSDCDGKPGELLFDPFDVFLPRDGVLGQVDTLGGPAAAFRVVALTDGLCLTGGKPYWASFIMNGVSTQGGTDVWYWGTTGSPTPNPPYDPPLYVKGSLPHRQEEPDGEWTRIDCTGANCLGCTDLNFCIRGERCKIVYDASNYKVPPQPAGAIIAQYGLRSVDLDGVITRQARAADDVTISPCETDLYPCVIEAYVWTNCTPPSAKLEIYETECTDDAVRPSKPALVYTILAGEDDAVYQDLEIDNGGPGPSFRLYCFKFKDFGGFIFEAGKTYWISAMGAGGNNATNDAYFAFSAPRCPEDVCYRLGNEGWGKSAFDNSVYPDWTPTSLIPGLLAANDFAMLIAVRNGPSTLTNGLPPTCRADFDRSGQIAVADIFSFLSEWFSGCP